MLGQHFGLRRFGEHPETLSYSDLVFPKFLRSAVARMMEPACKAYHFLIRESPQGAGKSSAVSILFGNANFEVSIPRLETKDAADYVRGKWGIELPELRSIDRSELPIIPVF